MLKVDETLYVVTIWVKTCVLPGLPHYLITINSEVNERFAHCLSVNLSDFQVEIYVSYFLLIFRILMVSFI